MRIDLKNDYLRENNNNLKRRKKKEGKTGKTFIISGTIKLR